MSISFIAMLNLGVHSEKYAQKKPIQISTCIG